MSASRLEWKVGLFVLISLSVAAALIMRFSKSASVFTKTYELLLVTSNVGGIRPGASVLMSGVQVGIVRNIDLDDGGKTVVMHIQIQAHYKIYEGARFTIEQAGFLGDQYISITPGPNRTVELKPGETVACAEPFNLQEVARNAAGLLRRVDQTAARLDEAVARIDRTILSEETLTNLSSTVANFRMASEQAISTLHGVDGLVESSSPHLGTAISNLVEFSQQLNIFTAELQLTVATNRNDITTAIQNIESGTVRVNSLLSDLQAGKGLVGGLLKDDELRQEFSSTVSNFSVFSSNLTVHGVFWKPKVRKTSSSSGSATSIYTGRNPSR